MNEARICERREREQKILIQKINKSGEYKYQKIFQKECRTNRIYNIAAERPTLGESNYLYRNNKDYDTSGLENQMEKRY